MIKQVKNRRGDMTIWGICLSLSLVILFTPVLQFLNISREAYSIQQKIQNDLNSFVTVEGLNNYDDLKNGVFVEPTIDTESFQTHLGNSLGLTLNETTGIWAAADKNFSISNMQVVVSFDGYIKITATYKLHVRTVILGQTLIQSELDKSAYTVFVNK